MVTGWAGGHRKREGSNPQEHDLRRLEAEMAMRPKIQTGLKHRGNKRPQAIESCSLFQVNVFFAGAASRVYAHVERCVRPERIFLCDTCDKTRINLRSSARLFVALLVFVQLTTAWAHKHNWPLVVPSVCEPGNGLLCTSASRGLPLDGAREIHLTPLHQPFQACFAWLRDASVFC